MRKGLERKYRSGPAGLMRPEKSITKERVMSEKDKKQDGQKPAPQPAPPPQPRPDLPPQKKALNSEEKGSKSSS
jgi:hypothetical protein